MPTYTSGMGKGLREPVSPYRDANVFGAALNEPDADGWNDIPAIVEPTTAFDLSKLTPGHEVVVALLGIRAAAAGVYHITFNWYRVRDEALLFSGTYDHTSLAGGWFYAYSYIGYVDWEINENGGYRVDIAVTGAGSYKRSISFTIVGIPEIPVAPPVPTNFIEGITSRLATVADFCYSAFEEVSGWIWPFSLLASPFLGMASAFGWLVYHFTNFGDWVSNVTSRIKDIFDFAAIWAFFKDIFTAALSAWDWIRNAWVNVTQILTTWWQAEGNPIRVAINAISKALADLSVAWTSFRDNTWPEWTNKLSKLKADWDYFWTVTFPTLLSKVDLDAWWAGRLKEVDNLITGKLKVWFPFYDDLVTLWGGIKEFFADPLQWLYNRLDEWFERFW